MVNTYRQRLVFCLILSVLPFSSPAKAQDSVADRIDKLEQELAVLKQQLQTQDEEQKQQTAKLLAAQEEQELIQLQTEKAAARLPKVDMGKDGLKVTSAVGNYSLRLRGYVQVDSRTFISDQPVQNVDTFLLRRARPIVEGTAGNFGFRLMPDFAGANVALFDAYAEYKPSTLYNVRAGKFKPPIGLDRLRSATDITFVERSMPTNLVPLRDVGLMGYGEFLPGFTWELGYFNGAEDLGNSISDPDNGKEFAARLFALPFAQSGSALQGLGIGVGGSWGDIDGTLTARQLPAYRSPSQAQVFIYRATSYADGDQWRIAPQAYFYAGPFGLQAEYTVSSQEVANGVDRAKIENSAWEVQARYVLTGEAAGNAGWPVPAESFNPWAGDWGAWEIAARYGVLDIDDAAFPLYADSSVSIQQQNNFGFAVHAYLNSNVRLTVDYENTRFDGGAPAGLDRPTEKVILARVDYKF